MSHAGGCPLPERHPACGTHVADQDRLPFATLWPRISGRDLSDRDVLRPGILTVRLPAKSTGKRAYMLTPIYAASVHPKKIGRAHVCTPVTNAHLVCRLLLDKKKLNIA